MHEFLDRLSRRAYLKPVFAAMLFLLFSPAICNAQVSCTYPYGFANDPTTYWYTPNITSVSPSTWEAGKTYNISIVGTGLVDVPNPYRAPQTPSTSNGEGNCNLGVILTKSGSVTVSNVSFVSATLVTATVTPDVSVSTQTACVTVGGVEAMGVMQPADTEVCSANAAHTATATVQIVGCTAPTITSIKPNTWFTGKTYDKVIITGSNFITKKDATDACPVTTVNIPEDSGAVPKVTVDSATQITVTVVPGESDPTESATVTASNNGNTGTYAGQILGNEILCDPSMQGCGGDTISTIGDSDPPLETVVVGQPIVLRTNPNLPATIKPYKTTWTVGGTNIGGYAPTPASATVTPTKLNSASLNSFWVYPASSIPVTYQYCVNIPGVGKQCSMTANATFNVIGPPTAKITPTPTYWSVSPEMSCPNTLQLLYFGVPDPTSGCLHKPLVKGISFDSVLSNMPVINGSAVSGTTEWVQIIETNAVSGTLLSGGKAGPTSLGVGLDKTYPYPPDDPLESMTTKASDSPSVDLDPDLARETRRFKADMYYLWKPQISGSIFVPLGYVEWESSGTSIQHTKNSPPWSPASSGATSAVFHLSSKAGKSYGFPIWEAQDASGQSNTNQNDEETLEEQQ